MESRSQIAAKVTKLLALARSSNIHEAATAAAHAQRLMARHRIDAASLGDEGVVMVGVGLTHVPERGGSPPKVTRPAVASHRPLRVSSERRSNGR